MSAKRPRQRNDRAAEYERQKLARRAALAAGKKRERKQENKKRVDNRSRPGRKRAAQQRGYRWLAKADDAAKAEAEQRKKGDEARAKAEAAQAEHAQQSLERQLSRQRLQAEAAKAEAAKQYLEQQRLRAEAAKAEVKIFAERAKQKLLDEVNWGGL